MCNTVRGKLLIIKYFKLVNRSSFPNQKPGIGNQIETLLSKLKELQICKAYLLTKTNILSEYIWSETEMLLLE